MLRAEKVPAATSPRNALVAAHFPRPEIDRNSARDHAVAVIGGQPNRAIHRHGFGIDIINPAGFATEPRRAIDQDHLGNQILHPDKPFDTGTLHRLARHQRKWPTGVVAPAIHGIVDAQAFIDQRDLVAVEQETDFAARGQRRG